MRELIIADKALLVNIADAVRAKNGSTEKVPLDQIASDVENIVPVLEPLEVVENGTYTPGEGVDGFDSVTVDVPTGDVTLQEVTFTENGTYVPEDGVDGFNSVKVEVPEPEVVLQDITVTENGEYIADSTYDGLGKVTVEIDPTKITIFPETTLDESVYDSDFGYVVTILPSPFEFALGETYNIKWDGVEYECPVKDGSVIISNTLYVGNAGVLGLENSGEPFIIAVTNGVVLNCICLTDTAPTVHTVNVWKKIEDRSDDVRYVTFRSYDGLVEYGKKAVAVGDDCADPVEKGIFDKPTKASDENSAYDFIGWSEEVGGGLNEDALKSVSSDKTVYAVFEGVLACGECGESASWRLTSDGVLTISGEGTTDSYESNSEQPWYDYASSVNRIVVEDGIDTIGYRAFQNLTGLISVEFADSVKNIGNRVFYGCENLTDITIPYGVTSIGSSAFSKCSNLTSINIPASVTSIGYGAFSNCTSLTSVKFEKTTGWWYASSNTATSGTSISSSSLASTSTAATYLQNTYSKYYWFRT